MRDFRRLPPVLHVASIVGRLLFLAAITLWVFSLVTSLLSSPYSPLGANRMNIIALNLYILGLGFTFAIKTYSTRFRQPDKTPYPLDSWQSQMRAIALMSVPPICALALAVVIPPTSHAFEIVP